MKENNWIEDAKKRAGYEAEFFLKELNRIADELMVDRDWFIEEAMKAFNRLIKKQEG